MTTSELSTVWAPRVLSILRIVAALIFFEHGTQKLFGFPPRASGMGPGTFSLLWFAAVIEIVGGVLLLLGLVLGGLAIAGVQIGRGQADASTAQMFSRT